MSVLKAHRSESKAEYINVANKNLYPDHQFSVAPVLTLFKTRCV